MLKNILKDYKQPFLAFCVTSITVAILLLYFFAPISNWFHFPMVYFGDGLWSLFLSKTVVETGWYANNIHLGAPFGAIFLDFAKPETFHLAFIRLLGFITTNNAAIVNVFYLFGFFAVAWSALWVLRHGLGLDWILAITGAIIYTILPFHFFRLPHIFLSNYFVAPLIVWLALQLSKPSPPFYKNGNWHIVSGIWLILIMIASTSIYYAYFALLIICITGFIEMLRQHSFKPIISTGIIVSILLSLIIINLSPSLIYRWHEGPNMMVAQRHLWEGDLLALRPIELILPMENHHSTVMAAPTRKYNEKMQHRPIEPSSLGILASLGFLILWVHLLTGQTLFKGIANSFHCLARINAIAVILAVAGGISAFVGLIFMSRFRGMNRISIIIGFVSLAGLLLVIDYFIKKSRFRNKQALLLAVMILLLGVAIWDQIPNAFLPSSSIEAYKQDHAFFQSIEQELPSAAKVYQLPHIKFPETAALENEGEYALVKPFLHTTHIRWSYGGMKNRDSDLWQDALDTLPINAQLQVLEKNGFAGILIERLAYHDKAKSLEEKLKINGLTLKRESPDKQFVFYSLPTKIKQETEIMPVCQYGLISAH